MAWHSRDGNNVVAERGGASLEVGGGRARQLNQFWYDAFQWSALQIRIPCFTMTSKGSNFDEAIYLTLAVLFRYSKARIASCADFSYAVGRSIWPLSRRRMLLSSFHVRFRIMMATDRQLFDAETDWLSGGEEWDRWAIYFTARWSRYPAMADDIASLHSFLYLQADFCLCHHCKGGAKCAIRMIHGINIIIKNLMPMLAAADDFATGSSAHVSKLRYLIACYIIIGGILSGQPAWMADSDRTIGILHQLRLVEILSQRGLRIFSWRQD